MNKQLKKIRNKLLLILVSVVLLGFVTVYTFRSYSYYSIPSNARQCLFNPSEMILYSIDPTHGFKPTKNELAFHSFKILGSLPIDDANTKLAFANEVKRIVFIFDPLRSMCFNPRHAIRVANEKESYDFLICFECDIMEVYQDEKTIATVNINGTSNLFNELLEKAKIPLAPK
jgi:hypothetical protein